MGEETPCSEKSSTWVGTARSCPVSSPPCPGWDKWQVSSPRRPWRHSTSPAKDSQGWWPEPPRCCVQPLRAFQPSRYIWSTPLTPLVLPQLYYWGWSVELNDIEPKCTVQQLSANGMSLSVYFLEHDLGLKYMNWLIAKNRSITFSFHQ